MRVKQRRHRLHANPFTIRHPIAVPDWQSVYGRAAPLAIDIGCGPGMFVLELARRHPEWNVLGLEIREHLVERVRTLAHAEGLTNAHAILANANVHLEELVPASSVAFVSVNFPDPWFKHRHHKRRVLNPSFLPVLLAKLRPEAELHFMSDYEAIAKEARALLDGEARLCNIDGIGSFAADSTTGIATEREITHTRRGEPVYRLRYRLRHVGPCREEAAVLG